jgi:asparagine synthase (glutamine-hydrolysing)
MLVLEDGGARERTYWAPGPPAQDGGLEATLEDAVRLHLRSDVPLAVLLSGGLDSSLIAALAAAELDEPLRTFSVGFADAELDERAAARTVAEAVGSRHEELLVETAIADDLPLIAASVEQPLADPAAIPLWYLCRAVAGEVKVALAGDGGDEVFGGYERYRAHSLAGRVPNHLAEAAASALGRVPRARREPRSTLFRARRFLDVAALPAAERYGRLVEVFPADLRRRLWSDEALARATSDYLPAENDLRLVDLESYLPGDLLPKSDLASMAVSIELRSPFLDHRLVELGLALPRELAFGKVALKRAFADDLPPGIADRSKTGFGVPLDRWFREELRDVAHDLVLGGASRGLFRRQALEQLLREHEDRRADHGHRLWCLCMLELWQRTYVDAPLHALAAT